jgi:hypothetical protein
MMLLLLGALVVVILFIVGGCSLSCSKSGFQKGTREGYSRSCLRGNCGWAMERTPVDYAMKNPMGWQRNPHWKTRPSTDYQPLDYGPVDFWPDERKLNKYGVLFQQYRQDWKGCGIPDKTMANDSKNRFDLQNVGAHGARVQLDDMANPGFGPGVQYNERTFDEPNPYFDKLYGGARYIVHGKLTN